MSRQRLIASWVSFFFAGFIIFIVAVYLFFPIAPINSAISGILVNQGLSLSPPAEKTLLPGLKWSNSVLSSELGALVGFDKLSLRLIPFRLLIGRVMFDSHASLGSGVVKIEYALNGERALDFQADAINLGDIPFFKTVLGAQASGLFSGKGSIIRKKQQELSGDIKLELKSLQLSGVKLGAFPLPDVSGLQAQGMIRVATGKIHLESLTLEGDGVYMRLSGDLPSGDNATMIPLNLMLEIMPKPEFLEKQKLVFLLMAKFMTSPGVYRVPVKGTLLKPEIL